MSKVKSINYYTTPFQKLPGNNQMASSEVSAESQLAQVGSLVPTEHPIFSRAIIFDQEINEMTAIMLRAEILQKASEDPEAPIYLLLGSPGGGLYESLAIYDTFQMVSNPIVAICSGKVMSGGILILLGCDVRVATKNTTFMIHHGHTSLTGNVVQLEEQVQEIKSLNDRMLDIIIKETKISREQLKSWLVKDHYMSVPEASIHGLIHGDIESFDDLIVDEGASDAQTIFLTEDQLKELEAGNLTLDFDADSPDEIVKKKATKKKASKKKATKKKVTKKKTSKKKVSKKTGTKKKKVAKKVLKKN